MVEQTRPNRARSGPASRLAAGGLLVAATCCAALLVAEARRPSLEAGRGARHYAAFGEAALARGDLAAALAAARLEVAARPDGAAGLHRLAYFSTLNAGRPTQEGLGALAHAYAVQPFGTEEEMAWRVAFTEANWAAMPDALAMAALTQLEALGGMGGSWEFRTALCRDSKAGPIVDAACATVPGVDRAWHEGQGLTPGAGTDPPRTVARDEAPTPLPRRGRR